MNAALNTLFDSFRGGNQLVLLTGRSLGDIDLDTDGNIRPLRHLLAAHAGKAFQMATLNVNLAVVPRWDFQHLDPSSAERARRGIAAARLESEPASGNYDRPPIERTLGVLRSLQAAIAREELPPLFFIFEYSEDILGEQAGQQGDIAIQIGQIIQLLNSDYHRRRHPLFVLFSCEFPECLPERIGRSLATIHLPNPGRAAKGALVQALKASPLRKAATYDSGIDDHVVANLTANTPNSGLERIFLESARLGRPIRERELLRQKREDIQRMSLGTLLSVDTSRVRGVRLQGRMVQKPLALLRDCGRRLRVGDPRTPTNVLLSGAMSTAKTDLCLHLAETAGVNMVQLLSPKSSLNGATERQARLQWRCLSELQPTVGFVDEFCEMFPVSRSHENLDSGASAAVHAELLTSLSDSSRAGKNMLLATTNTPFKMGAALRSRFTVLPVVSAVAQDYAAILGAIAAQVEPALSDSIAAEPTVREAAGIFFEKGATPRVMREALLVTAGMSSVPLGPAGILEAAQSTGEATRHDRESIEFADLWALKLVRDRRFLPWADEPESFPFPPYLQRMVRADGSLDPDQLNARIAELSPRVDL